MTWCLRSEVWSVRPDQAPVAWRPTCSRLLLYFAHHSRPWVTPKCGAGANKRKPKPSHQHHPSNPTLRCFQRELPYTSKAFLRDLPRLRRRAATGVTLQSTMIGRSPHMPPQAEAKRLEMRCIGRRIRQHARSATNRLSHNMPTWLPDTSTATWRDPSCSPTQHSMPPFSLRGSGVLRVMSGMG